ncbi:MAG: ABC-F family ATP-binding cassette domain-containing protein [Cyclobacteriaceae bacterium]|nr:ABC-F family ATP-binding cassette domain-containing protein [Cyclobacteriaceae bacterium]
MNYLSVENLTKSFGERVLFDNISFGLAQGQKMALVGVNGSGKSTLLKIVAGLETPDSGQVSFRNDIHVAFLEQNPEFKPGDTVLNAVFDGDNDTLRLIKAYEENISRGGEDQASQDELSSLIEKMDAAKAWDYESKVKEILGKLNIHDLEQPVAELSGGQKKRVAIARVFIEGADVLIMDEPTNHLDLDLVEWLESYLSRSNLTLLLVTHDRWFLESVTNSIIEIDREQVFRYDGNYSYYLEKKAEREMQMQSEVEKARNLMRKELDWIRRQPKARSTKAKYRVDAFEDLKVKARQKLEKSEMELDVSARRQGKKVIEVTDIQKSFDGLEIIRPFSYTFKRGEKIGILGKNGVGKTTFLNMLTGKLAPDAGEVDKGQNTTFGYYTQQELRFKPGQKVIDLVKEIAEVITLSDGSNISASQFLNHFQFPPKVQHDFVDNLSGGEKRRLQLMQVLIKNPNFLILDEPTNDLDLITLGILEDFLSRFQGCLLIVSHDRYFMDRLVEHVFIFEKGQPIKDYPFNYSQYRDFAEAQKEEAQKEAADRKDQEKIKEQKVRAEEKTKLSYKEKQEYERLEGEIEKLEKKKALLVEKLNAGQGSFEELKQWADEIEQIITLIEGKEMRWLELSDRI